LPRIPCRHDDGDGDYRSGDATVVINHSIRAREASEQLVRTFIIAAARGLRPHRRCIYVLPEASSSSAISFPDG
jgi:hypothetical protein